MKQILKNFKKLPLIDEDSVNSRQKRSVLRENTDIVTVTRNKNM
jgi:hypothetical protein